MIGLTILFGLVSSCAVLLSAAAPAYSIFLRSTSFLFGLLFLVSLLIQAVRGRAH